MAGDDRMKKFSILLVFLLFFRLYASETLEYDILMLGSKVGEAAEKWEEIKSGGDCLSRLISSSEISIDRGGNSLTMKSKSTTDSQCGTYAPLAFSSTMDEGGSVVFVKAKRNGSKIEFETTKNSVKESGSTEISGDIPFFGMIFKKYPESFFLKGGTLKAISEESIAVKDMPFNASRKDGLLEVNISFEGIPMSFYIKNGIMIRSVLQGGLLTYELKGNKALPVTQQQKKQQDKIIPQTDMLLSTALENTGVKIDRPRKTIRMSASVANMSEKNIPATCFQKVTKDGSSAVVSVDNSKVCPQDASTLKDFLGGNIYEDKDSPAVKEISARWARITDRKKILENAVSFVYLHISDKNYNHGNLSASEVIKKQAGDCTEHATLLSALLKSLGIPVKMAYGIVLSDQNKFFFHNWVEVYIDNSWVPVDPTFNEQVADSARIVLIYGGNTSSEREGVSLAILKFLQGISISITGFGNGR